MKFEHCIIKPFKGKWAVFTIEPLYQKGYVWLITREKDHFLQIPMWTDRFKHKMKSSSMAECIRLAQDYDKFVDNSEW